MNVKNILRSPAVMSAILFQLGWFVCILAPQSMVMVCVLAYLCVHYFFICRNKEVWIFSLRLFFIGVAIDSFWVYSGVIELSDGINVIPFWLIALWGMFALSAPFGFAFLRKNYVFAAVFGLLGAPVSYFGGAAIRDDVMLASPIWLSLFSIGISWAMILMLSNFIQEKMKLFLINKISVSSVGMPK